jgi:hypothetical protein
LFEKTTIHPRAPAGIFSCYQGDLERHSEDLLFVPKNGM